MWCDILVPEFGPTARARVVQVHVQCGDHLAAGTVAVDLEVDLSGGVIRDCPPMSTCRIVIGEALWVRRLHVEAGAVLEPGALIAELSLDANEMETLNRRQARTTAAAILRHSDWWHDT